MWDRMKQFDENGDGKITAEEFGGSEEMFKRVDADGDGVVTKAEVEKMQSGMRGRRRGEGGRPGGEGGGRSGRRPSSGDTDWVFKKLDRDQDGILSSADLKLIAEVADKDKNGKISEEEFNAYLKGKPVPRGTAPETGARAPDFKLKGLTGKTRVALGEMLKAKKPVVLIFGSLT